MSAIDREPDLPSPPASQRIEVVNPTRPVQRPAREKEDDRREAERNFRKHLQAAIAQLLAREEFQGFSFNLIDSADGLKVAIRRHDGDEAALLTPQECLEKIEQFRGDGFMVDLDC